jgi:hypothetical protein
VLPKCCGRCVQPKLPNTGTIVAPSAQCSYESGQNHCSCAEIVLMYVFISPPVSLFQHWVDKFLHIIEFLCWSILHFLPEQRLLHAKFNALNRIAVTEACAIMFPKVVWISDSIVWLFAMRPIVNAHWVGHFVYSFYYSVGQSEIADSCYCCVSKKLVDCSSAQDVIDAAVC